MIYPNSRLHSPEITASCYFPDEDWPAQVSTRQEEFHSGRSLSSDTIKLASMSGLQGRYTILMTPPTPRAQGTLSIMNPVERIVRLYQT
jgi:hypothetical protein